MAHSSQSFDCLSLSRAESLFKACEDALGARTRSHRVDVSLKSRIATAGDRDLSAVLGQLGLADHPVAVQCFGSGNGATEHAAANIVGWMGYLPPECISTMVRDGWHWST
jgi:hypothetical protein